LQRVNSQDSQIRLRLAVGAEVEVHQLLLDQIPGRRRLRIQWQKKIQNQRENEMNISLIQVRTQPELMKRKRGPQTIVISVNKEDTSIPAVMVATTFFTVSSYASGLRITSGLIG